MKIIVPLFLCFNFNTLANPNKAIYGTDSRVDYNEIEDKKVKVLSQAVAAMIDKDALIKKEGYSKIIASTLENESNCRNIKFKNQISIAKCSGFLVDNDKLATSGTCVKTQKDCEQFVWAFNMKREFDGGRVRSIKNRNLYRCLNIIKREHNSGQNISYTILQLDRVKNDVAPLALRTDGNIAAKTKIIMLGHPQGLPLKLSQDSTSSKIYQNSFRANLDSDITSAGSPVFDLDTLSVQGMYLKGPRAQTTRNGCNRPLNRRHSRSSEVVMHAKLLSI